MKGNLPPRFTGAADSPGFILWELANAWQSDQREALEEIGLTHVQFVLLACLGLLKHEQSIPVTQSALARYSRVDMMTTSYVMRGLERRGAVVRQVHPTDSRAKSLALTAEGADLLEKARPLVEQADATFFRPAAGGLENLVKALKLMAAAIRDDPPAGNSPGPAGD